MLSAIIAIGLITLGFVFYKRASLKQSIFGDNILTEYVVLEIKVPKIMTEDVNTGPLSAEHMFASLHGLLREDFDSQEHLTFELAAEGDGRLNFYCTVPKEIKSFVESQIYAQYPSCQIRPVEDYAACVSKDKEKPFSMARLELSKENFFPIKTFRDFEVDPISGITSVLSQIESGEKLWFQLTLKPLADVWQEEGHTYVKAKIKGEEIKSSDFSSVVGRILHEFTDVLMNVPGYLLNPIPEDPAKKGLPPKPMKPDITGGEELQMKSIEFKLAKIGFAVNIRFYSQGATIEKADANLRALVASFKQFSVANLNGFVSKSYDNKNEGLEKYLTRTFAHDEANVLTTDELASIFHLPSGSVETPNINWVMSKKAEPPANLPTKDCTYIGETMFRNQRMRFGIRNDDDRLRHMYLIGKTGTGKSTLFKTLITQDIANGAGVGVLDPHGELIEDLLEYIPDHRLKDVVLVDPSDVDFPVGINLMELSDPNQKNLMASALVGAVRNHFDYSWGPRLEYLLNYAVLTLLDVPGTSLLGITRLMADQNYQRYILHKVKDPVVIEFWDKEFKEMKGNQKLVTEAIAPIQNKINRFLSSTTIRNILGQKKSTIDIWDIMNSGKILFMNLSKGKIGTDNANLLGALLVSRIQFMALHRAKLDPKQRKPFYLYVDEFQNFVGGDFESILSESRKYGLGLYLTHQYTSQLPETLQNAVFGNVGTIAAFSLGAPDARVLESEFEPYFDHQDIIALERFQIYMKLMIDGMTSQPFSARILLPWKEEDETAKKYSENKEKARQMSRETYGRPREQVEDVIKRWINRPFDKGMAIADEMRVKGEPQNG